MSAATAISSASRVDFRTKIMFWLGVLFLLFVVYDLGHVGDKMPYGMHQWRQCDAYSMALNYAMEPRGLFEPAIHFQHGAGGGEAVGEFPPDVFPQWKTLESDWAATLDPPVDPFGAFAPRLLVFVPDTEPVSIAEQFAGPDVVDDGLWAHGVLRPQLPRHAAGLGLVYVGWWEAYKWWQTGCMARKPQALMVLALPWRCCFVPPWPSV